MWTVFGPHGPGPPGRCRVSARPVTVNCIMVTARLGTLVNEATARPRGRGRARHGTQPGWSRDMSGQYRALPVTGYDTG
eukprot:86730-Hanusia_phi.AAC.1